MGTRVEFQRNLRVMHQKLVQLSELVDQLMGVAMVAFEGRNAAIARQVIESDERINRLRWELENFTYTQIATQAPMAGDLRSIVAVLHIATNLERMGDHASGVARLTLRIVDDPTLLQTADFHKMSELGRTMLKDAILAFEAGDADKAREIARRDEDVNDLYQNIFQELINIMIESPTSATSATYLLWLAHNLERFADRVTNICERTVYAVSGQFEEVNDVHFEPVEFTGFVG